MVLYDSATLKDIVNIQRLLNIGVNSEVLLPRSDDEIAINIKSYILAKYDDVLVGMIALHIHSPYFCEIRSLIVDTNFRGKGIGRGLVLKCIQEAKELNAKSILALTYHQKAFFESLHFKEVEKSAIGNDKIWADCLKRKRFSACDVILLMKEI